MATLVVQVVQVAQECHLLAVACLPQEWIIDLQAHLAPMALIVALMGDLMVAHMALMDLQGHMVLLGLMAPLGPMDLTVDIMVVRQAHTDPLVWGRTMGPTRDLLVDLHRMACKVRDTFCHTVYDFSFLFFFSFLLFSLPKWHVILCC